MACLTTLEGESWKTRSLLHAHVGVPTWLFVPTWCASSRYIGREAEWRVAVAAAVGDLMQRGFRPPAPEHLLSYQAAFAQCRVDEMRAFLVEGTLSTCVNVHPCIIIQDLCPQTNDDLQSQSLASLASTAVTAAGDNRRRRSRTVKGTASPQPSSIASEVPMFPF